MDKGYFIGKTFYEAGKKYVEEMSPFSEISRNVLYECNNISRIGNKEQYDLGLKSVDFNVDKAYDVVLVKSNGNEITIPSSKIARQGYDYLIYYDLEFNPIAEGILEVDIEINEQKVTLYVADEDWNFIDDIVGVRIEEIIKNSINTSNVSTISYSKIKDVPDNLSAIERGSYKAIFHQEYQSLMYNTIDTVVIDKMKCNESPYPNANKTNVTGQYWTNMTIKTKYSEGIEKASGYKVNIPIAGRYILLNWFIDKYNKYNFYIDIVCSKNGENTILKSVNSNTNYSENIIFDVPEDNIDIYILYRIPDTETSVNVSSTPKLYYGTRDLKHLLTSTNVIPYEPTTDYNPATKKYVDERTFSREVVPVNNVNDSLTLTTDMNQYATLAVPVEIILPTVTSFTELHLFFSGSEGVTIGTTDVKWESQVTIENNKSYEIIFTYVNESIGWLAKTVVYS